MSESPTIVFAGGGTGGHLYPSLAIAERLGERPDPPHTLFICSNREIDQRVLTKAAARFTPSVVRPLPSPTQPWRAVSFLRAYLAAKSQAIGLLKEHRACVVVAMGGFVSGPVVAAARSLGVPTMLVNLDAAPGKANRWLARSCDRVYTVYPWRKLPTAQPVSVPLRNSCLCHVDQAEARRQLRLEPAINVLMVTGASQGADSINRLMIEFVGREPFRAVMKDWQILHLSGAERAEELRQAYRQAGVRAVVMEFCHTMGLAWGAADLAVSRAGANSVAEIAANAVPALYLPYPFHKDQHQKLNAQPYVDLGGAVMFDDLVDPAINADRLLGPLVHLMRDEEGRKWMASKLKHSCGGDGASALATAAMELASRYT